MLHQTPKKLIRYAGFEDGSGWDWKKRKKPVSDKLGRRQEEALSYLIGLAPMGQTIEVPLKWVFEDLGFNNRFRWYEVLNHLIAKRYVNRVSCAFGQTSGVLMVLRRPVFSKTYGRMVG